MHRRNARRACRFSFGRMVPVRIDSRRTRLVNLVLLRLRALCLPWLCSSFRLGCARALAFPWPCRHIMVSADTGTLLRLNEAGAGCLVTAPGSALRYSPGDQSMGLLGDSTISSHSTQAPFNGFPPDIHIMHSYMTIIMRSGHIIIYFSGIL